MATVVGGAARTLTLLLADVEGSVRHWEDDPQAAPAAMARLDEIVSASAMRLGGARPLEQGEGDSFVLAFDRPSEAVACALEIQLATHRAEWPGPRPVRVRMAVHTGEVRVRDDGRYAGHAFNRCARMRALANGGQVLLTHATRDLVADALPEGASLRDLGELRLRDLARAERVFQLEHPGLPADFPSPAPARHLPQHLSSFVGRRSELAELESLIATARILTLTGAGGAGKTRLAARVAELEAGGFPDGAWWLELAPITDPDLVPSALAQALGVRSSPGSSELDAAVAYLAPRRALVVLDNCEHVLDSAAAVAEALARGCPKVCVLATSREPLRAEGETEWRIPSMSMPESTPADRSDAVLLFAERARQVRPDFVLTEENLETVGAICRELDGIPLAIELAAARLRAFSLDQIAAGLADRFRLLSHGARTALPRQQTLRGSVDWSHDLLSDQERTLFRRLGVFAGGFSLEAAEDVCSGEGIARPDVLDLLAGLVEKSLVQAEEAGASVRYRLLETMRQYAFERLDDSGEADMLRDAHRDHYLELAESTAPQLLTPAQPDHLDALDPDSANFDAAIERASQTDPEKALRLCVALTLWWRQRFLFAQAEAGFTRALDAAPGPSSLRAHAMWGRALMLTFGGRFDVALPAAQEAVVAAEEVGDDSTTARALWLISVPEMWLDPVASRSWLERARETAAACGDEFALMHATQGLGMTYFFQEDLSGGRPLHDESFELAQRIGQQDAMAWYWVAVAVHAWSAGDRQTLDDAAPRALAIAERIGDAVTELPAHLALTLSDFEAQRRHRILERMCAARDRAFEKGALMMPAASDLAIALGHIANGELDQAASVLEAVDATGAGGFAFMLLISGWALAEVRRLLGDSPGAQRAAVQAITLAERIGNRPRAAEAKVVLAYLAAGHSDWSEAQRLFHEALPVAVERGTPRPPRVLEGLATVAAGLESHAEAARLLGAAGRLWAELAMQAWPDQRRETEALRDRVREALGQEAFDKATAEGAVMSPDEVVAYLRRARGERKRPSSGWESLTPTELEVARLVAEGLTNPQVAERMFVSAGTVRTHLSHVFAKLDLRNRAELAREVARRAGDI